MALRSAKGKSEENTDRINGASRSMGGRRASLYKPGITRNCHGLQSSCGSEPARDATSSRFFGIFRTGLAIAGAWCGAYSRCSPIRRPGLATWEVPGKIRNCYKCRSVYFARCALWQLYVGDLRICRVFLGFNRFANLRTAATFFVWRRKQVVNS